jgi:hypothetical protein
MRATPWRPEVLGIRAAASRTSIIIVPTTAWLMSYGLGMSRHVRINAAVTLQILESAMAGTVQLTLFF